MCLVKRRKCRHKVYFWTRVGLKNRDRSLCLGFGGLMFWHEAEGEHYPRASKYVCFVAFSEPKDSRSPSTNNNINTFWSCWPLGRSVWCPYAIYKMKFPINIHWYYISSKLSSLPRQVHMERYFHEQDNPLCPTCRRVGVDPYRNITCAIPWMPIKIVGLVITWKFGVTFCQLAQPHRQTKPANG